MNIHQVTPRQRVMLERAINVATEGAALSLSRLLGVPVDTGDTSFEIISLEDAIMRLGETAHDVQVVYLDSLGDIDGQMLLLVPSNALSGTIAQITDHSKDLQADALGELGNVVLTSYINELSRLTGLSSEPTPPLVASDGSHAVLEMPIAKAAGDRDVVVHFDGVLLVGGSRFPVRSPFRLMFMPAPGCLAKLIKGLGDSGIDVGSRIEIPVRMGEIAISNNPGEMLVSRALGSCVGIVLVDHVRRVAGFAHVMLPTAPGAWRIGNRPTYAGRYADSAVHALLEGLQRIGSSRHDLTAYIAGGSQMFKGAAASNNDLPQRNIESVIHALNNMKLPIAGKDVGGTISRSMFLDMETLNIEVRHPESRRRITLGNRRAA